MLKSLEVAGWKLLKRWKTAFTKASYHLVFSAFIKTFEILSENLRMKETKVNSPLQKKFFQLLKSLVS